MSQNVLFDRKKQPWIPLSGGSVVRPGELVRWRREVVEKMHGPLLYLGIGDRVPLTNLEAEMILTLEGRAAVNAATKLHRETIGQIS